MGWGGRGFYGHLKLEARFHNFKKDLAKTCPQCCQYDVGPGICCDNYSCCLF